MNIKIQDIDPGTYEAFQAAYDSGDREFNITIDSYGGSLDAAFRIYDLLRGDPDNKVTCSVRGNCISATTVILCAAPLEMRSATKNSTLMIHSPLVSLFCADINKSSAEKLKGPLLQMKWLTLICLMKSSSMQTKRSSSVSSVVSKKCITSITIILILINI